MCVHACVRACVRVHVCVYGVHTRARVHVCVYGVHTRARVCVCVCMSVCVYSETNPNYTTLTCNMGRKGPLFNDGDDCVHACMCALFTPLIAHHQQCQVSPNSHPHSERKEE